MASPLLPDVRLAAGDGAAGRRGPRTQAAAVVRLLQDTVALINEMRKGNQEGAARIMSGMNQ